MPMHYPPGAGRPLWLRADLPIEALMPRPLSEKEREQRPQPTPRGPNAAATGGYGYIVADGVATIPISGVLVPGEYARYFHPDDITDTARVGADVRAAAADDAVEGVVFAINSPGGFVDGAYELADTIAALSAAKPTASFGTGVVASAAYLQAAMTGSITAFRTTEVGSIGTRSALYDLHRLAEQIGIDVIPIDSGGMKSAGLPGTKITREQIAYFEGLVGRLNDLFVEAVARGRGMQLPDARRLADGRVHVAADAVGLGLIDRVGGMPQTLELLFAGGRRRKRRAAAEPPIIQAEGGVRDVPATQGAAADSSGGSSPEKGGDMPLPDPGAAPTNSVPAATPANTAPAPAPAAPVAPAPAAAPVAAGSSAGAATLAQLRAACPGASNDFLVEQIEQGATVEVARTAYIAWQQAQLRDREQQLAAERAATERANARAASAGYGPVPSAATTAATPAAGNPTDREGRKALAKQEWQQNAGGCRDRFINEGVYVGFRVAELEGRVDLNRRAG